ncbi:NAD+ synthase [Gloeocapsa sp. PCC 73106]|uniref:NAD+ synthase n=1 Tax=Gloeocapsa sp. PCC 73106 TaxID=102232 RepID=UPI0002AC0E0A|nr:NAD+ synthase [Gloeocapsa sp. PCC 73106]ELR98370.1 NAD+ synthetase [Gloeocapsa sp. PCC 73106]
MKIAIAQLNPVIGDLTGNAAKILASAQKATTLDADLLLTPELSLCGYPPRDLLLNPNFIESMSTTVDSLSQQLPCKTLVGTVQKNHHADSEGEKTLYNTMALLSKGQVEKSFVKRLLPTYDVFDEHRYFASGKESGLFLLHSYRIGVTICEDLWNDEQFWGKRSYRVNPVAELAALGVDLIVNLSASPYTVGKQRFREKMLRHVVKRYNIPLIYVNQVGGNDDLIFDGHSLALNRQGEIICRAQGFAEDLLLIEFDPLSRDLLPTTLNPLPSCETAEIWSALVLGVKDYTRKCGFKQVILGLSGGIDSALVAAIAAEALGSNNVLGVMMPSPYSSEGSVTDATALADNLGIKTHKLPIETLMTSYDQVLAPLFAGTEFGIAEENIQSRIRGNLLMAIANKFGYLLISTGNKSEIAVGYCTLYGDMNGGLAVIADLPKTLVFSLCHWLNREKSLIPENILLKPPSAELKPDQIDQDSLPSYDILDDILEQSIQQHRSFGEIIASGHDRSVVEKVLKLVARAEFKRKQSPPGLKVTDRAFGTGWRMPIASQSVHFS